MGVLGDGKLALSLFDWSVKKEFCFRTTENAVPRVLHSPSVFLIISEIVGFFFFFKLSNIFSLSS